MEIIFGLIGIVFLIVLFAAFIFLTIFLARKIGLLKPSPSELVTNEQGEPVNKFSLNGYATDFKTLSESLIFRFILIAVLIGFMMIPLNSVNSIVAERSQLYRGVLHEVATTWGHKQKLQGPVLFIPFTEKYENEVIKTDKDGNERKVNNISYKHRTAVILPDDLDIEVMLNSESRKRSIYESLVYTADLKVKGDFVLPKLATLSNHIYRIHWDQAWLSLGISDTQAINKVSQLNWGADQHVDFEPGTRVVKLLPSGFHAPLDLSSSKADERREFLLKLNVNGSGGFYFSPFGKTTDVSIASDWPHPSFQGNVLPDTREISADGFNATWSVPHLARNYPQLWSLETHEYNLNEFSAGVNLFESVSLYSQVTRAIKYGLLFFTLTYITFLLFELGIGRRLHIVQYGVIGLALSMFYLTLLSMAEHSGFFKAYISAAAIIIVMISLYAYAALRKLGRTLIITVLLFGLYSLLYSLLKLEDYALLAGTALLLVILAVLMYLTRNLGRNTDTERDSKTT